jgi:hypothetical protein
MKRAKNGHNGSWNEITPALWVQWEMEAIAWLWHGGLAWGRLERGEIRILDGLDVLAELLLDCLDLLQRGGCVFGIANPAVEPRQQVVNGAVLIA